MCCCHCQTGHVQRYTRRLDVSRACRCVCWCRCTHVPRGCVFHAARCARGEVMQHLQCLVLLKWDGCTSGEMKSLNLDVGNGISKHWPFCASWGLQRESHDSRIFTVPPVSGPVKSQRTWLKPARLQAGLEPHRQTQRWFFFLWCTAAPHNMEEHERARVGGFFCTYKERDRSK